MVAIFSLSFIYFLKFDNKGVNLTNQSIVNVNKPHSAYDGDYVYTFGTPGKSHYQFNYLAQIVFNASGDSL